MLTYTLAAEELTEAFMRSLRTTFSGKTVEITVTEISELDETEYLFSSRANREHLLRALTELESGKNIVELDINDLV